MTTPTEPGWYWAEQSVFLPGNFMKTELRWIPVEVRRFPPDEEEGPLECFITGSSTPMGFDEFERWGPKLEEPKEWKGPKNPPPFKGSIEI